MAGSMTSSPTRVLLATDLTSGCDRALDRAVELARAWHAELHVVHAIPALASALPAGVHPEAYARARPETGVRASRQLRRLLGDIPAHCHIAAGPAATVILDVAERIACDLVVLGESHGALLGPLESTVERVVRASAVSALVVRERPTGRYRRIIVGTDLTDEARQALEAAAELFPAAAIQLVHAAWMPYAGLLDDKAPLLADLAAKRVMLAEHLEASSLPLERRATVSLHVDAGPPAVILRRTAEDSGADLVVIGAHARGLVFDAVLGASRSIMHGVPGDLLVLRATRSA